MVTDRVLMIASSIIKNEENKILLLKRSNTKTFQGYWQLPEGKIESREKPLDALRREMNEELGVGIRAVKFQNVNQSFIEAKGVRYFAIRIIFEVELDSNDIKLSSEYSDYKWFKYNDFEKKKILPGTKEAIKSFI